MDTINRRSLADMLAEKRQKAIEIKIAMKERREDNCQLPRDILRTEQPLTAINTTNTIDNPTTATNPIITALLVQPIIPTIPTIPTPPSEAKVEATQVSSVSIPSIPTKKLSLMELLLARKKATTENAPEHAPIGLKESSYISNQFNQNQPEVVQNTIKPDNQTPSPSILADSPESQIEAIPLTEAHDSITETFSLDIILNSKQLLAKELAFTGKSFCLVGAAGTGKTTAQREVAKALLLTGSLGTHSFRVQGTKDRVDAPSIAFVAYTRVASGNLRRAIHKDPDLEEALAYNVTTIHNLLEYTPEYYFCSIENREKFRFTPKRTASNPLDITHLVIEESSMVGLDLWEKLFAALRLSTQIIFIGDINQLPPVFGDAILNYALIQLPVIELTEVYRQKGDSSILANAHRILRGEEIVEDKDFRIVRGGTVNHTQAKLAATLGKTFPKWRAAGEYDPLTDIILSPWNKRDLGTDNMNKWIAQSLGTDRLAVVFEIIAGMNKLYLAVGDKIMYNKQVGVIVKIAINGRYSGRAPLLASTSLTRFGTYTGASDQSMEDFEEMDYSALNLDRMLEDASGDITREASHIVDILLDDGDSVTLSAVGDFGASNFSLAYCLTVHKAQGCEWRKVYIILHRDHSVSLCRELLYTAVTRAREQVVIIAKDDVINKAIKTQRIKGSTTKEKIEYFNSGIKLNNAVYCTK